MSIFTPILTVPVAHGGGASSSLSRLPSPFAPRVKPKILRIDTEKSQLHRRVLAFSQLLLVAIFLPLPAKTGSNAVPTWTCTKSNNEKLRTLLAEGEESEEEKEEEGAGKAPFRNQPFRKDGRECFAGARMI